MFLIFLTGGAVLALEVMASRIMTPYFGVSLYIWAGILSITLTFLAVGYYLGGEVTKRIDQARQILLFYAAPVVAAAAVVIACVVYPFWFQSLARFDLAIGSFIASGLLLAVPIVCLSAMNPLLISLRAGDERQGDSGAGRVFFISTAGSVAGVLFTAFVLIPVFTNFEALLWVSVVLSALAAAYALRNKYLEKAERLRLVIAAAVVAVLSVGLIVFQERYFKLLTAADGLGLKVEIVAEYTSVFGNLKVARVGPDDPAVPPSKVMLHDGIVQNRTTSENVSISMYTYVLDRLARAFAPQAKSAIVLGLGAGIVPADMKRRNMEVTVVDIDPNVVTAARDHFDFKPDDFTIAVTDARTFVRACAEPVDVAVVDLFQGDSTPDYLMTVEFFTDLRRCLKDGGAMVMNAFFDEDDETPNRRLLATIAAAFDDVFRFHVPGANAFVVATAGSLPVDTSFELEGIPGPLMDLTRRTLQSGQPVRRQSLLGYDPVTDRHNHFSTLMAGARMADRKWLVGALPARLLVN